MASVWLIFPHQLFFNNLRISKDITLAFIEDSLFFFDSIYPIKFHKLKLVFHRASMKAHQSEVEANGQKTLYFDYVKHPNLRSVIKSLQELGFKKFFVFDPVDYILRKRLLNFLGSSITVHNTPNFINTTKDLENCLDTNTGSKLFTFYVHQRKKHGILLIGKNKPAGGKWSFDTSNRKRLPKNIQIPDPMLVKHNEYVKEAIDYVENNFKSHPGTASNFFFAVTRHEAKLWLENFVEFRLCNFGPYQDFVSTKHFLLFHSLLSPYINVGLLDPVEVLQLVESRLNQYNLSSIEGFVRQILGWREYMRFMYEFKGSIIRKSNFFCNQNRIKNIKKFSLEPLDFCVTKTAHSAYLHHIERLMIVGNIFLLCEIHPDEVYKWFMQNFIDAYDWVMVPNVYSMSQFACGGLLSTKPYFSSSNYILRMSDFKPGEWCNKVDGLFYRFVSKNADKLLKNLRLKPLILRLLNSPRLEEMIKQGDSYINFLKESDAIE